MARAPIPLVFSLAAILLAAPSASAVTLQLTATALEAPYPNAATGELVGILLPLNEDANLPLPAVDFRLTARHLRLEVDSAFAILGPVGSHTAPPDHSETTYRGAMLEGTANRAGARFDVLSNPEGPAEVSIASTCSHFTSSPQDEVVRFRRASTGPPPTLATSQAVAWKTCDQATITVTGDFILYLWEWDATLTANGQEQKLQTGREVTADAAPAASLGENTEAFLFIEDGALTFTERAGTDHAIYLRSAHVESAAGFTLHGARGALDLPGLDRDLRGETATLHGSLSATLQIAGAGEPLSASISGDVDAVEVAGQVFAVHSESFSSWWFLAVPALILAGVVAVRRYPLWYYKRHVAGNRDFADLQPHLASSRQKRAVAYFVMAERSRAVGRFRLALYFASRSLRLDASVPETRRLRVRLRTICQRYEATLEDHEVLDGQLHGDKVARASNAVEAARTLCALGRGEEALRWLHLAVELHSASVYPLLDHRDFAPLQGHAWFRAQRQQRAWQTGSSAYQ